MLSWGRVRRALQPLVLKFWLNSRSKKPVRTRVEGLDLEVFPGIFHPKYFGSSSVLARFVSSLPLKGKTFLEVGCGSGVVALCAAQAGAEVTAVDIHPEAVRCTASNASRNNLRVDTRHSDLFSALGAARFDVIAWNPPFLPGQPESPAQAAFYGGLNLEVIRRFSTEVRRHVNPGAAVYTILSSDVSIESVETFFRDQAFSVTRVHSKRWGLGETMVILCAR